MHCNVSPRIRISLVVLLVWVLQADDNTLATDNHAVIWEKNLFSPERREYKQQEAKTPKTEKKKPKKKYWPQLRGTVIGTEEPMAILLIRLLPLQAAYPPDALNAAEVIEQIAKHL